MCNTIMKRLSLLLFALQLCNATLPGFPTYRFCVPKVWLSQCEEMIKIETATKINLICTPARDRYECLNFILQRQADFTVVDPEDMYAATKIPNEDFIIFGELRSREEPLAEYRYQAVMVVKNTLPVTSLTDLRGLKSCHTGINRNVGYKIPLAMFLRNNMISPMNDDSKTPTENELNALSQLFSKSCLVGKWSPDNQTNSDLKKKYSNLCEMCEHPTICDSSDQLSGYEGSLRCLASGGDVAFTKTVVVKKFFGLPVGTLPSGTPTEDPDQYSFLCTDGSKISVKERPCSYAARPWQALMSHPDVISEADSIRRKFRNLAEYGNMAKPDWLKNVVGFNREVDMIADSTLITPKDYLRKSNYSIVIERGRKEPEPVYRLCVTSDVALSKCEGISAVAYSRDVRPRIKCVLDSSTVNCLRQVESGTADAASAPGHSVSDYVDIYNLQPALSESFFNNTKFGVAVVKKDSPYNSLSSLQGKRSCHNSIDTSEGFIAPLNALLKGGYRKKDKCNELQELTDFFSGGSCLPGAMYKPFSYYVNIPSSLRVLCGTNNDPIRCLAEDRADVAFVSDLDVMNIDNSQYELLCLNKPGGGRAALSNWTTCNTWEDPPQTWLTRPGIPEKQASHVLLHIADLLTRFTIDIFDMFGSYLDHNNIMFTSTATGLMAADAEVYKNYKTLTDNILRC